MKLIHIPTLLILFASFVLLACDLPSEYSQLMNLPEKKRLEQFDELPLQKQVDYYLLRSVYSHPPDTTFAEGIAKRGESAFPYLLERIKEEPDDYKKELLIKVFKYAHMQSVDLRYREDITSALEGAIEQIHNQQDREMALRSLQFIREHVPTYASDYNPSQIPNTPPPTPRPIG